MSTPSESDARPVSQLVLTMHHGVLCVQSGLVALADVRGGMSAAPAHAPAVIHCHMRTRRSDAPGVPGAEIDAMLCAAAAFVWGKAETGQVALAGESRLCWEHSDRRIGWRTLASPVDAVTSWIDSAFDQDILVTTSTIGRADLDGMAQALRRLTRSLQDFVASSDRATAAGVDTRARSRTGQTLPDVRAADRIETMARTWATGPQVSRMMGSSAGNASQVASMRRRNGDLLGVWITPARSYRFPPWQFRRNGQPIAQMAAILERIRACDPVAPGARRRIGWGELAWFLAPNRHLDGRCPADVIGHAPEQVLDAAVCQFAGTSPARGVRITSDAGRAMAAITSAD